MRTNIASVALAAFLGLAACTPDDPVVANDASDRGEDASPADASHTHATLPIVLATENADLGTHCANAISMESIALLTAQRTPVAGDHSTLCMPSDAPQRYYRFAIPPRTRAIVTATQAALSCPWRIVLRAIASCDGSACVAAQSNSDDQPASLTLDGAEDAPAATVVSVSGVAEAEGGAFDISVRFERW